MQTEPGVSKIIGHWAHPQVRRTLTLGTTRNKLIYDCRAQSISSCGHQRAAPEGCGSRRNGESPLAVLFLLRNLTCPQNYVGCQRSIFSNTGNPSSNVKIGKGAGQPRVPFFSTKLLPSSPFSTEVANNV